MKKALIAPALVAGAFFISTAVGWAGWKETGEGLEAFNNITKRQALSLIAQADKTGDPQLLDYSGWVLARGLGVEKDFLRASKYFSRAADRGNNRGWSHLIVLAGEPDFIQAIEKAAEGKDGEAQNVLGELYAHGWGVGTDYPKALENYKNSASNGFVTAERNVGMVYQMGWGVPQSYGEAMKWFRKAAAKGDAAAEEAIGKGYQEGWSVKKDYAQAKLCYEKALRMGEADAENDLGWLYEHGLGVPKDEAKAKDYYEQAAVKGNSNAANNLGFLFHTGEAGKKDDKEALKWYLQGANGGNTDSLAGMSKLHLNEGLDPRSVIHKTAVVHFDYNKSDLKPEDLQPLRTLGEFLVWARDGKVKIDGYCDNRGKEQYNQALSVRRAATICEFLLYHGARKAYVEVGGHGDKDPMAPNDTEENMAKNRRVEIKVEGL